MAPTLSHPCEFPDLTSWLRHIASFTEFRWHTVFRRALSPPGHRSSPYTDWSHFITAHSTAPRTRRPRSCQNTRNLSDLEIHIEDDHQQLQSRARLDLPDTSPTTPVIQNHPPSSPHHQSPHHPPITPPSHP
jgi:hypothetical protein